MLPVLAQIHVRISVPAIYMCLSSWFLQIHHMFGSPRGFWWAVKRGQPNLWACWQKLATSGKASVQSASKVFEEHLTGKTSVLFFDYHKCWYFCCNLNSLCNDPRWSQTHRLVTRAICEFFFSSLAGCNPEMSVCEVAVSFISCFNHYYILYYYLYYVWSLEFDKVFHNVETFWLLSMNTETSLLSRYTACFILKILSKIDILTEKVQQT